MAEITLIDPQGAECTVGTPEEANNLLCRGYRIKPAPAPRKTPRPAPHPESP